MKYNIIPPKSFKKKALTISVLEILSELKNFSLKIAIKIKQI
jgi:hypothetical protein